MSRALCLVYSDSLMPLNHLLASLPPELGLQELVSDAHGICELVIDHQLKVLLEEELQDQSLHLYSVVATVPDADAGTLLATLLEGQLFGREIGAGMAFGLDRATGDVLLWRKLSSEGLEPEAFNEALTEFINWAEHWQAKLSADAMDGSSLSEAATPTEHFIRA